MANNDNDIRIEVRLDSPGPTRQGFGVPMFLSGQGAGFTERIRFYESADEVNDDADLGVNAKAALLLGFSQPGHPERIAAGRWTGPEAIDVALTAVADASDEWFAFATEDRTDANIKLAAAWAQANGHHYKCQSNAANILATAYVPSAGSDLFNDLKDLAYDLTSPFWYSDDGVFADFAWICNRVGVDLDVETTIWRHNQLVGVIPDDSNLTSTQKGNVLSKSGNMYLTLKKRGDTTAGTMASGDKIDLIYTREWTKVRLEERFAGLFAKYDDRKRKIPFTNPGVRVFTDAAKAQLLIGVDAGHFANIETTDTDPLGSPFVVVDDILDMDPSDIENRILKFQAGARAAGAIEEVDGIVFVFLTEFSL